MEDFENPSAEYLKGFNDGYLLAKHEPELAKQLDTTNSTSERMKGFKAGVFELTKEKNRDFYPAWLKENKSDIALDKNSPEKDKGDVDNE